MARSACIPVIVVACLGLASRIDAQVRRPTWGSITATSITDAQPLGSFGVSATTGGYVSANAALEGFADLRRQSARGGNTIAAISAGGQAWSSSGTLKAQGRIGFERAGAHPSTRAIWLASGSARLTDRTFFIAEASRAGYHHTLASIDTLIVSTILEARLDRSASPGLAGAAALRTERFEDDNEIRAAYMWVLAPVTRGLRLGYAAAARNASTSRWAGNDTFDPYYTPAHLRQHDALAEITARMSRSTLRINAAYGFSAREDAPVSSGVGSQRRVVFVAREFDPWSARASLDIPIDAVSSITASVAHQRTAYYRVTTLALSYAWLRP